MLDVPLGTEELVVFRLERQRYAVPLDAVVRVVHAVEVTPLPGAPPIVLGAINVEGRILPVLNVRRRFLLPEHEVTPADRFLIARAGSREVVLVIDEVEGVAEQSRVPVGDPTGLVDQLDQFAGVMQLEDGLVLIHDLEKFLSPDEANALSSAPSQD